MILNKSRVFFDALTHTYFLGNKELSGVTSLMRKHGLAPDYSGIKTEVLMAAAERGTAIHKMLEDYDNGEPVESNDIIKAYKKLGLNILASEYLVSDNDIIASSLDKVIYVDEHTVDIGDIKTTSSFHSDSVSVQLSIYKWLFELQNPDIKVRNLYGIHIRNNKAKLIEVPDWGKDNVERLLSCERTGLPFVQEEQEHDISEVLDPDDINELVDAEAKIQDFKAMAKFLEAQIEGYREEVIAYMKGNGIKKMKMDGGTYTLKDEYLRESIDTAKLKADHPTLAAKYSKASIVKASVTFKGGKE